MIRRTLLAVLLCGVTSSTALAGSGPWVVGAGSTSLFAAVEAQRLTMLSTQTPDGPVDVEVGEGLSAQGFKLIGTYGIQSRAEVELAVPWFRVYANRPDAELCGALGLGACRTTQGIGLVQAKLKGLLLDELFGSPVSLSTALNARYGAFTADDRERITNIGEGTFDLGPSIAVGRSSAIPSGGDWSAYAEAGWLYRFANTDSFPDLDTPVPGSEFFGEIKALVSPGEGRIGLGPSVSGLWRPWGLEWHELEAAGGLADVDRFGALKIYNVRVGGELLLRGRSGMSLTTGALRTVAARNNPSDVFIFSIGLGINRAPEA
ncbi:MAG: hypothetical protein ACI8S6_002857 [Myxococcota bacterium]|jgi:hypothetical protein